MALSYIDDLRSRRWVGFAEVAILAPELLIMRRRERSASSRIGIGRPWETKCWSAIAPCGLTRAHTHTYRGHLLLCWSLMAVDIRS